MMIGGNRDLIPEQGLPHLSVLGSNTLVVYATVPDEVAKDGTGRTARSRQRF